MKARSNILLSATNLEKWTAMRDAVLGEFPGAWFCEPDQNPSPELCRNMIRDFGGESGRLAMITQHSPWGRYRRKIGFTSWRCSNTGRWKLAWSVEFRGISGL